MNRLRARFSRGDEVKYISHLDTLRTFERAVRREGLPIAYSLGFNPRPQMSFGLPLSVGVTSCCEYVDFELESRVPEEEFVNRLNNNLPRGFRLILAEYINSDESLMSSIGAASYRVDIEGVPDWSLEEAGRNIEILLKEEQLIVEKESKKGIKHLDIRPHIYSLNVVGCEGSKLTLDMLVSAGSRFNLKPEMVVDALRRTSGEDIHIVKIHRTGLFGENVGQLMNN